MHAGCVVLTRTGQDRSYVSSEGPASFRLDWVKAMVEVTITTSS
jgi:hypothetical protein